MPHIYIELTEEEQKQLLKLFPPPHKLTTKILTAVKRQKELREMLLDQRKILGKAVDKYIKSGKPILWVPPQKISLRGPRRVKPIVNKPAKSRAHRLISQLSDEEKQQLIEHIKRME